MFKRSRWRSFVRLAVVFFLTVSMASLAVLAPAQNNSMVPTNLPRSLDRTVNCELLVAGGGVAGVATAYEALQAGRTVCLTELTDWVGGQLTSQGTSALDEAKKQRSLLFYSRGYKELRQRIERKYGKLNPGECWVSVSCFLPNDAEQILTEMLQEAAKKGKGTLQWFPSTVIKNLDVSADGKLINAAIAIQHRPAPGTPPLNTEPLSQTIEDAYRYEDSPRLTKQIIRFVPQGQRWIVVDATETGELIALADVTYRVGLDPRTYLNPSSPTETGDPYCLQGFTYTFAMEQTETDQPQQKPPFYEQYEPYYGYDADYRKADFNFVFTYRRIWSPKTGPRIKAGPLTVTAPTPGDISMQNWVWGNDYRPGTAADNLVYSRDQLQQTGQLAPGNWMGGLRTDALRKGEELALGFYYWLAAGTTDSQLGAGFKKPALNHRLLTGFDAPMGTAHGLSKYPYMREGRRLIGRSSTGYPNGFSVNEIDVSRADYRQEYYRSLPAPLYRSLWIA
ncbi:MAG TPA: FAD-dependent oxidoreductase, partial [Crinalium sp.]